jgi:hypothetical protein
VDELIGSAKIPVRQMRFGTLKRNHGVHWLKLHPVGYSSRGSSNIRSTADSRPCNDQVLESVNDYIVRVSPHLIKSEVCVSVPASLVQRLVDMLVQFKIVSAGEFVRHSVDYF